jgi:hypothetical protein
VGLPRETGQLFLQEAAAVVGAQGDADLFAHWGEGVFKRAWIRLTGALRGR